MEMNSTILTDLSRYDTPIIANVICIIAVITIGGTGNGFVLYIYSRKMKEGNIFIRILAFLDLAFIFTILPHFPFMKEYYIMKANGNTWPLNTYVAWMFFLFNVQAMAIIFLAIDRALAVCSPLSYKTKHKRVVKMYTGIVVYFSHVIIIALNYNIANPRQRQIVALYIGLHLILFLSTLFVSYSVIIYKIRKQCMKIKGITTKNNQSTINIQWKSPITATDTNRRFAF